jgi:hypothetical protein
MTAASEVDLGGLLLARAVENTRNRAEALLDPHPDHPAEAR